MCSSDLHEQIAPGRVPRDCNPVTSYVRGFTLPGPRPTASGSSCAWRGPSPPSPCGSTGPMPATGYAHIYTIAHLVLALAVFSLSTLVLALRGDNAMEVLFLAEHSLMVIIGLVLGKRLISMWGAGGVTLALIYLLSGYAYALAILAGLSIITAVVVVVARGQRNKQKKVTKNSVRKSKKTPENK